jgi:hypothetical protein
MNRMFGEKQRRNSVRNEKKTNRSFFLANLSRDQLRDIARAGVLVTEADERQPFYDLERRPLYPHKVRVHTVRTVRSAHSTHSTHSTHSADTQYTQHTAHTYTQDTQSIVPHGVGGRGCLSVACVFCIMWRVYNMEPVAYRAYCRRFF